jgi:hypothetical protein
MTRPAIVLMRATVARPSDAFKYLYDRVSTYRRTCHAGAWRCGSPPASGASRSRHPFLSSDAHRHGGGSGQAPGYPVAGLRRPSPSSLSDLTPRGVRVRVATTIRSPLPDAA